MCSLCHGKGETTTIEFKEDLAKDDPMKAEHQYIFTTVPCALCKEKGYPPFVEIEV